MVGVPNENGRLGLLGRGVCQAVSPVFASRAMTNCLSCASQLNTSRPSTRIGDPPQPCCGSAYSPVRVHSELPFRSRAAVPMWPKWTYSRSPSVVGVGLAWLFFLWILAACCLDG